jgi:hypothetical protein
MSWWAWVLLALVLFGVEALTPGGFFVLFFGCGALVVGLLGSAGITGPVWVQWLLFSVISIGSLVLFRNRLLAALDLDGDRKPVDTLVGETTVLLDDLAPGGVGKAELRGTTWTVRSSETSRLERGRRCRVERVDGLTLWVRSEQTEKGAL